MAAPYLYSASPVQEAHVHFPQTYNSELMLCDKDYSLLVVFLPQALNDPSIVQSKIVELYGGRPTDYPVLRCAPRKYIVRLPEYMDRDHQSTWIETSYFRA